VSLSSDSLFQRAVSVLHTSYLDSASEHGFQYTQVTFVKNDIFLNEVRFLVYIVSQSFILGSKEIYP
jgi:hypothetical protein